MLPVAGLIVGAAVAFSTPALAAPGLPRHPATFAVDCEGMEDPVKLVEATGAAGFTAASEVQGVNYVAVSAQWAIYRGTEPDPANLVDSSTKAWGAKAGITERLNCTRVNTVVHEGQTYTAFESFVLASVPTGR